MESETGELWGRLPLSSFHVQVYMTSVFCKYILKVSILVINGIYLI